MRWGESRRTQAVHEAAADWEVGDLSRRSPALVGRCCAGSRLLRFGGTKADTADLEVDLEVCVTNTAVKGSVLMIDK
jgi:hypothetical protein